MNSLKTFLYQTEEIFAQMNRFLLFSRISHKFHSQICSLWLLATMIKGSNIGTVFKTMIYGASQINLHKVYGLLGRKAMISFQGRITT